MPDIGKYYQMMVNQSDMAIYAKGNVIYNDANRMCRRLVSSNWAITKIFNVWSFMWLMNLSFVDVDKFQFQFTIL